MFQALSVAEEKETEPDTQFKVSAPVGADRDGLPPVEDSLPLADVVLPLDSVLLQPFHRT